MGEEKEKLPKENQTEKEAEKLEKKINSQINLSFVPATKLKRDNEFKNSSFGFGGKNYSQPFLSLNKIFGNLH
jgi:hypothetical protein